MDQIRPNKTYQQYLNHFDPKISQKICDYANNVVLLESRYIFTFRIKKLKFGYCTHCKSQFPFEGWKHNEMAECPKCKSNCKVKSGGLKRGSLFDRGYFVFYEKSKIDPNSIVAKGIEVIRDYRGDYLEVETKYYLSALYVFKIGESVMLQESWGGHDWQLRNTVFSLFSQVQCITKLCAESIEKAISDTPFQYSMYQEYMRPDNADMVRYFDTFSKYPCIEYLTKFGLKNLVNEKLQGYRTYSAINWRGKNLLQVLKLTKTELKELKQKNIHITFALLKLIQLAKKEGTRVDFERFSKVISFYGYSFGEGLKMLKYGSIEKVTNYLEKQLEIRKKLSPYIQVYSVIGDWKDYIADCQKLGLDITSEYILYPKDLHTAHQNTINQIKHKEDEALAAKIKARQKELQKLKFEAMGIFIRPAVDAKELIAEGKALHHCVGGYADRYAKGELVILVIRRKDDPDTPFYTMEVRGTTIYQTRGMRNCSPTDEVQAFVNVFEEQVLKKKIAKVKVPA